MQIHEHTQKELYEFESRAMRFGWAMDSGTPEQANEASAKYAEAMRKMVHYRTGLEEDFDDYCDATKQFGWQQEEGSTQGVETAKAEFESAKAKFLEKYLQRLIPSVEVDL